MAMEIKNGVFELPINVAASGTVEKTLKTEDTYVDKNIKVIVNTPDASFEIKEDGALTATVSTTDTTYTSSSVTPYAINIAADAHIDDTTVGVATAGYADSTDTITISGTDAEQNTKTLYLKEGALGGSGSAGATGNINLTKVSSQPSSGFYIKASGAGNVSITTAGWVDPSNTTAVTTDGDAYYTVKTATLSNSETGTFTEASSPVLTEDGYLYINEGYIKNTKISLATLVPDDATITGTDGSNDLMYNTISAYDKDGKLIAGSMGDAELGSITANGATASITSGTVAASTSGFTVSGSASISGSASVAISKRGLATTSMSQTGTISGTASATIPLSTVTVGTTVGNKSLTVTPVIEKNSATNAKTGDITTSAPTEGYYVVVDAPAISKSTTAKGKVTSEGYGTTAKYTSATADTITAGSAASGAYYVPLTAGSHSVTKSASEISAPVTTVTTAFNTGDVTPVTVAAAGKVSGQSYIAITSTATTVDGYVQTNATCTSTEGYVTASTKDIVTKETVSVAKASATAQYIKVYDGSILS